MNVFELNIELNINDYVVVLLTPTGVKHLYEYYESRHSEKLITYHYKMENIYEFQLWELMRIFGKYMDMGAAQCFEDNRIVKQIKRKKGEEIKK